MAYIRVVRKKLDQVMGAAGQEPPPSPSYCGHALGWANPLWEQGLKHLSRSFVLVSASFSLP